MRAVRIVVARTFDNSCPCEQTLKGGMLFLLTMSYPLAAVYWRAKMSLRRPGQTFYSPLHVERLSTTSRRSPSGVNRSTSKENYTNTSLWQQATQLNAFCWGHSDLQMRFKIFAAMAALS